MAWTMIDTPCYTLGWRGGAVRKVRRIRIRKSRGRHERGLATRAPCPPSMGSAPEPQEETMRPRRPQNATLAAVCGSLGLLLTACGGLFDGGDTKAGLSCVDDCPNASSSARSTLKAMLADKDRTWVEGGANPAGACLGRQAVRVPRSEERDDLRGAWRMHGARPTAPPRPCAAPTARASHRLRSRAPPCSPPRSPRSCPPRCAPAAARRERGARARPG